MKGVKQASWAQNEKNPVTKINNILINAIFHQTLFLEQFWVHSNIEGEYKEFPYIPPYK
jgi:hypothetical protein